ncbi:MAG: hypothetical protein AB1715_02335, partial [Acidobacteriota bacterium]
ALGYLFLPTGRFSPGENGFFGLLAGLVAGAVGLYLYYKGPNKKVGWPVIVAILDKEEDHG